MLFYPDPFVETVIQYLFHPLLSVKPLQGFGLAHKYQTRVEVADKHASLTAPQLILPSVWSLYGAPALLTNFRLERRLQENTQQHYTSTNEVGSGLIT